MEFLFRHDHVRPVQDVLLREAYDAVRNGKHFLAHAPTGIGKTDATISAALTYALDAGKVVIYLSPKISQHEMALKVVSGISRRHGITIRAVEFIGKQYMCANPVARRLRGEEFYELCRRMREKEICPQYVNYLSDERGSYWPSFSSPVLSHADILEKASDLDQCPYEVASDLLSSADVVVADYYHVFSPQSGKVFLKKLNRELSDIVLIVDEAHNLPERVRSVVSYGLSTSVLSYASKEARGLDPEVSRLLQDLSDELLSSDLRSGEQRAVSHDFLHEIFAVDFSSFADELEDLGREYLEITGKGRSALLRVARFLRGWDEGDGPFLHYVHRWRSGDVVSVVRRALDPAYVTKDIFHEIHASILVSGTFTPGEMYRDLLGLDSLRTVIREYPSPFPAQNRLTLIVPTVTTRYSKRTPEHYRRIAETVSRIVLKVPGNSAVFFPSYDYLSSVLPFLDLKDRPVFVQQQSMKPDEIAHMLSAFRANRDRMAVLLAVAGGSLSEGVDFPGQDLVAAIIVGIPLAEMNLEIRAMIDYFEKKFGRGWFYAYIQPAVAKALQAAGRVIRSESDRGVVVFLDERYTWKNYKKAFPKDFSAVVTNNPEQYLESFWR